MIKQVRILGKRAIPTWLLVLALIAAGAGAAAGTVLAGKVTGVTNVAVSQALLVKEAAWLTGTPPNILSDNASGAPQQVVNHKDLVEPPNRAFAATKDDNTAFQVAAEVATGDWVAFDLDLKNASSNALYGLLTLNVPAGLEVEAYADNTTSVNNKVSKVVRVGLNAWKFLLAGGADPYASDNSTLTVVVSTDDDMAPGFYTIDGTLKQIAY